MHDLSPLPAMLVDHRFDVHAWNRELAALVPGLSTAPPQRRNTIDLSLFEPVLSAFYPEREVVMGRAVADLRAAWANNPDDVRLGEMIHRWRIRSEEFARLWRRREVRRGGHGHKRLQHPTAGPLTVEFQVLEPLSTPSERLMVYRATDSASQMALDRITTGPRTASVPAGSARPARTDALGPEHAQQR